MANVFPMPMSSWAMLKQIIRAYGQVENEEKPTVDRVAEYAAVPRPVVSANNNFLREIGIVSREENKPTELGAKLAATLVMENEALIAEALQEIVKTNSSLNQWVGMVRARGMMKFEHLKGTLALAGAITDKAKQTGPAKAIIDMLQEAKLIQIDGDSIRPAETTDKISDEEKRTTERLLSKLENSKQTHAEQTDLPSAIPFTLGPTRFVYVQLPKDWNAPKDLEKLLKLMRIGLGDSDES